MSKLAPLTFPKKGDAHPPADAIARAATAEPAPAPAAAAPDPAPTKPARRRQAIGMAVAPSTPNADGTHSVELLMASVLEGGDDLVQINITVPRRVRNQLHLLKLTGQAKTLKAVTSEAVIKAVEALLAGGKGGAQQ